MIKPEGRGFNSHPGQSFPLSLCGPISISRANAHMVYGLKHQHFTSHSITLYGINWAHNLHGFPSPCDSKLVRKVLEAVKRKLAKPVVKK